MKQNNYKTNKTNKIYNKHESSEWRVSSDSSNKMITIINQGLFSETPCSLINSRIQYQVQIQSNKIKVNLL